MTKINGNIQGIKQTLLERMESMYDMHSAAYEFISAELIASLSEFTGILSREISVFISRDGRVVDVSVGDAGKVSLPGMRLVRNIDRLCGVRCIHTHPNGDGRLSGVDLGTLRSMRLDSMAALGVKDGTPTSMYAAYVGELSDTERGVLVYGPMRPLKLPHKQLIDEIYAADERLKSTTSDVCEAHPERAILVGIENTESYDTMDELAELAKTAGAEVVGRSLQRRRQIDNASYIGSGKLDELSLMGSELEADLFIFDDELSAIQLKNIEDAVGVSVIDRTTLILDIFASRAQSREGKLQVELAQLKYRLPRLLGQGAALTRQGGGIGTRGPGEKKLEIDRRRIRRRIYELEQELSDIEKQRELRRTRREKKPIPLIALVGYTNAGKSTLLNALSGADVLAEDKLFATLDPVVRQVELEGGREILFSDTVGFINKLPHDIVNAFHSTLEEVSNADIILHVVDASSPYYETQMRVVADVLCSLGAGDTPRINVYNKLDKADASSPRMKDNDVSISALNGTGLDSLKNSIIAVLNKSTVTFELMIPYSSYDAINAVREQGTIIEERHEQDGTFVKASFSQDAVWRVKKQIDSYKI